MPYHNRPRLTLEESPWAKLLDSIPNTLLMLYQLNQQIASADADRAYKVSRDELAFARKDYMLAKNREENWSDALAKSGYDTSHITGGGETFIGKTTEDINAATETTRDNVLKMTALSADLKRVSDMGVQWQKDFAHFEDEDRETEYRKHILEGGLNLYKKGDEIPEGKKIGDVYGTGEFAEAIKSLSPKELDVFKDKNYMRAITKDLKTEAQGIQEWSALMSGQKISSEIGQKRSNVMWGNIIETADKFSGRRALQNEIAQRVKYGEYQDSAGNLTKIGQELEAEKMKIGREYEYLAMGAYTELPETATEEDQIQQERRWLSYYNTMAMDFDVATPKPGGYSKPALPGNQIKLTETIGAAYGNYQKIIASGDKEDIDNFAQKSLKYLGVNLNDADLVKDLDLQTYLDRDIFTNEMLASLEYNKRLEAGTLGPLGMYEAPELGPDIPEGGLPTPAPVEDISYYQHHQDYLDKATEAVWGPEVASVVQAIPLYQGGKKAISAAGTVQRHSVDAINQALFNIGATGYNVAGVPLNQAIKAVSGYSPGFSGERQMDLLLGWTGATPATDPDYSFGTHTPAGGFWTKDMSEALDQLSSTTEQLSKPSMRQAVTDPAVADSLTAIDTVATASNVIRENIQEFGDLYAESDTLQSLGPFNAIFNQWQAADFPDLVDWLLDRDINLEPDLIRIYKRAR